MRPPPTTIEIQASFKQLRFLSSTASNVVFQGGARSGKTWAGVLQTLRLACQYPCWGMYVSPTYKQLDQSAIPHLLDLSAKMGLAQQWKWNKTKGIIEIPNGGVMLLRSAEDPCSLLGATLGWAVCDEIGLWRRQAYDYLQDRLSDTRGPRQCYFTFTPKGVNWVYDILGQPREGLEIIHATQADNPTLPADYHERMRREHGEGSLYWRQEVLGEYVAWEGLVYPQFAVDRHVQEPPALRDFVRLVLGVDWGWTNPGVMLVVGMDCRGNVWVLDEVYERQRSIEWWQERARGLCGQWHGLRDAYCDPSDPANIVALQVVGVNADKANNEVIPGIAAVASRFANGELYIAPHCGETVRELGVYCWKSRPDGTVRYDEPEKTNDHALDALRYAIMGLWFGQELEQEEEIVEPVRLWR